MQEESAAFNSVYGSRIILIPIRSTKTSDGTENSVVINSGTQDPAPWLEGRPRTETVQQTVDPLTQINPEIALQIENIAKASFGDIFLSDSQRHIEKLQETALSSNEFPICYLTLTMLVSKRNPQQFRSIKDVLDENRKLGIVDPSLDGLGEASWTVLGKIVPGGESAIPMELVQLYERQYDLLEALELKKIDAALVWDATSQNNFLLIKYADEYNAEYEQDLREAARSRQSDDYRLALIKLRDILVEEKNFAEEVPLTVNAKERHVVAVQLVVLGSTSHYGYSKRFIDFMRSHQGKNILWRFGFVAR